MKAIHLYLIAVTLAVVLIVPPAAVRPLQTPDEGRYAEVARETFVAGNWLIPTMNGAPHLTKSAVYTDLVAIGFRLFGQSLFTTRLVSILAFFTLFIFSMIWAHRQAGRIALRLAAVTSLTMLHPVFAAQFNDLNMLLTCFLGIGMLLLIQALLGSPAEASAKAGGGLASWIAAWTALGLAFAVKGPAAFMIPASTLLIYRLLSRRPFGQSFGRWAAGIAIFLVLGLAWYGYALHDQGEKLARFWFTNVLERTSMDDEKKPLGMFFFYIPVFIGMSSGWAFCMIQLFWRGMNARRQAEQPGRWRAGFRAVRSLPPAEQWLLCWAVATLVIFSAMRAEMISYIQSAYTAAAMLLTLYGARKWAQHDVFQIFVRYAWFGAAVTVLATWGAAFYFSTASHQERLDWPAAGRHVETEIAARRMLNYPRKDWELVQCGFYSPTLSYLTNRYSILCHEQIHKEWPMPPQLTMEKSQLRERARGGKPMMAMVRRREYKEFFPEPIAGLRVLMEGRSFLLLTNMP